MIYCKIYICDLCVEHRSGSGSKKKKNREIDLSVFQEIFVSRNIVTSEFWMSNKSWRFCFFNQNLGSSRICFHDLSTARHSSRFFFSKRLKISSAICLKPGDFVMISMMTWSWRWILKIKKKLNCLINGKPKSKQSETRKIAICSHATLRLTLYVLVTTYI